MNLDEIRVERVIYGFFDYLGDLGGFNEALSWIGLLILAFTRYEPLNSYFVRHMFSYIPDYGQD